MARPPPRVLSLFSGIGGLDLALRRAVPDAEWVAYVEREGFAAAVLAARVSDGSLAPAPLFAGDVRDFPAADFRGRADVVTAGFPCPPVSHAGKRRGTEDERWLWPEVVRVLRETAAGWVLVENVSGLLTANDRRAFGGILSDLDGLGFDVVWGSFRASDVGAPHRRERVFILGRRRGVPGPLGGAFHEREIAGLAHAAHQAGTHLPPARGGRPTGADTGGPGGAVVDSEGRRAGAVQLERLDGGPEQAGEALADAAGLGGREGGPIGRGPETRHDAHGDGAAVAYPEGGLRGAPGDGRTAPSHGPGDRALGDAGREPGEDGLFGDSITPGPTDDLVAGDAVGDSDRAGLEGLRDGPERGDSDERNPREAGPPKWPPGPGERDEWARVLARWPDLAPATLERVRRVADGSPRRMDRLRALGNAVVPEQAELALRVLHLRLTGEEL